MICLSAEYFESQGRLMLPRDQEEARNIFCHLETSHASQGVSRGRRQTPSHVCIRSMWSTRW